MKIVTGIIVALSAGAAFGVVAAKAPQASPAAAEHKLLEKWAGNWDATVEGGSTAKSTSKLVAGGLWLVTDYEGSMDGTPFSGHEVKGYDPAKKKFVINWVDSVTTCFDLGEGDFDAKTNTLDVRMKSVGPDGAPRTWRQTDVWTDADTHVWTMYQPGQDGKDMAVLKITYKRKK